MVLTPVREKLKMHVRVGKANITTNSLACTTVSELRLQQHNYNTMNGKNVYTNLWNGYYIWNAGNMKTLPMAVTEDMSLLANYILLKVALYMHTCFMYPHSLK